MPGPVPMSPILRAKFLLLVLAFMLSACTSGSGAILQTMQRAVSAGASAEGKRLDPRFRYLRVTVDGRLVYLALGNIDVGPRGPVEVWYSAEREVIRLQDGRLIGAAGLATEWVNVQLPELPAWADLARRQDGYRWRRLRDVMPGYRFGQIDELIVRVVPPPGKTALRDQDPQKLTWFEERFERPLSSTLPTLFGGGDDGAELPPARYAVEIRNAEATVIYAEQCISRVLCFSWQRWTAEPATK